MRIGVGLPNVIPDTPLEALVDWARRIDAGPFTSAGVLHRVAYDARDPLETLAFAAAETERIALVTMVAVAPLYETGRLAGAVTGIQQHSGGRLVLGLAVGARLEDYRAAGVDPRGRGRRFDEQLVELRDGFDLAGGQPPPLLVGGSSDATFARVARIADGYVHGGGPPRAFVRTADRARTAWEDADRPGEPALWGQSYFALGDDEVEQGGRRYMLDYYAFTGPFAERIAEGLLTTPQQIAAQIRGYAEAGCDELVLLPAVGDLDQVDRLAEVVSAL
jgi:alkanesulfonate monooxygenase SsuD/methylene tetrahydromethanopterin reductase-like flavin-dependent oxidoreductase (luciferase family)